MVNINLFKKTLFTMHIHNNSISILSPNVKSI